MTCILRTLNPQLVHGTKFNCIHSRQLICNMLLREHDDHTKHTKTFLRHVEKRPQFQLLILFFLSTKRIFAPHASWTD